MQNKVVTLANETGQEVSLHCVRVHESTDRKIFLEINRENQTESLWWYMVIADYFDAKYEFRQEDKCVVLTVDQEMITAMYNY